MEGVSEVFRFFRCYMKGEEEEGGGGGVDTNLDVPPLILIFHNYCGDPSLEK